MDRYIQYLPTDQINTDHYTTAQPNQYNNYNQVSMVSSPNSNTESLNSILSSPSSNISRSLSNNNNNNSNNLSLPISHSNIPLPPSSTIETSNEPPRTLWMGDLDPNFDDLTIMEIWSHLNKSVIIKLIKAKKNILIPCSAASTTTSNNNNNNHLATTQADDEQININGVSFIDPNITPLHHAGYCFVEFQSQLDALFALSLNSKPIPNFKSISTGLWTNPQGTRTFRLNWASGATLTSSIPTKPEYSLFVGDLSPTVTEADLLTLFQKKFKSVKTVRVMTDPITGASRCFGFIRFGDETERTRALVEMNGVWCQNRALRVAFATPRNGVPQNTKNHQFNNVNTTTTTTTNNINGNGNYNYNYSIPSPQSDIIEHNDIIQHNELNSSNNNTTLFIGGLNSQTINEHHLISLFQPFGNIVSVKIPLNKNCAFIKFQSKIDSEAAMQGMQGFIIDGSPIRLSWGKNNNTTSTYNNTTTNNNSTYNNNNTNIQQNELYSSSIMHQGSMWNDPIDNINYSSNIMMRSNQLFQNNNINNNNNNPLLYGSSTKQQLNDNNNLNNNYNNINGNYYYQHHYLYQNHPPQNYPQQNYPPQNQNTIFH